MVRVPGLLSTFGMAGPWLRDGLFRLAFFFGTLGTILSMSLLLVPLWSALHLILFLVTLGRIRQVKLQVPDWLKKGTKSAAFRVYFAGSALIALAATWGRKWDPQDYGVTGFGYMILVFLCSISLRRLFPEIDIWLSETFAQWKQLAQAVAAQGPVDQLTFVLFPPAILFAAFLSCCAIFGPWYVSEGANTLFCACAMLSLAVICHRSVARPLWHRFAFLGKRRAAGAPVALLILVALFWVATIMNDSQFSPVPSESTVSLLLVLKSDRSVNPTAWSSLPNVPVKALPKGIPLLAGMYNIFQIYTFHSLAQRPAGEIHETIDLGTVTDRKSSSASRSGDSFDWASVNWTNIPPEETFHESFNSAIMRLPTRPRTLAAAAGKAPMSGSVSWIAPQSLCSDEHVCSMNRGAQNLPSSFFVGGEERLFALANDASVQRVVSREGANAVGVLGEVQLSVYCDGEVEAKVTGPLLPVERSGIRYVMAVVGKWAAKSQGIK